jgi:hypothetical protein
MPDIHAITVKQAAARLGVTERVVRRTIAKAD